MRRTLTTVGPDVVLVLDCSVRDRLKLAPHAEVEIEVSNETLIIRPVINEEPNPIREAFQHVIDNPGDLAHVSAFHA